jgi:site-specific recombinase XerC
MLSYRGRTIRYLDYDQTARFFAGITSLRDRALFATIYHYGLRVSEVPLLQLDDVDLDRGRIVIRRVKSGIGGERPLFNTVARLIEAYLPIRLSTGSALFTGRQGDLKHHRIQQLFKQYARIAELGSHVSVHSLRHSIATHLREAGQDIEFIQDYLGHVNIQNTLIYAQLTDRRREAIFRQLERNHAIVAIEPSAPAPPDPVRQSSL